MQLDSYVQNTQQMFSSSPLHSNYKISIFSSFPKKGRNEISLSFEQSIASTKSLLSIEILRKKTSPSAQNENENTRPNKYVFDFFRKKCKKIESNDGEVE